MFTNLQYAYLVGDIFFLLVWLILFLYRKDLRREIVTMSLLGTPLAIGQLFYLRDYWRPELLLGSQLGIEDFIFTFAISGIAAVVYEELFAKTHAKRHLVGHPLWMLTFIICFAVFMLVGNLLLDLNSIYISSLLFLLIGLAVLIIRHDLLINAVASGLAVGIIITAFYILFFIPLFPSAIHKWWLLNNLSGILILGMPIEELFWGFSWGFLAGPIYEFVLGIKLKDK